MAHYKKLGVIAFVEPCAYDEDFLREKLAKAMLPKIEKALQIHAEPEFFTDEFTGHTMELTKVSAVLRIKTN